MRKGPIPRSPRERFLRHVNEVDSGCWLWTGAKQPNGYGTFAMQGSKTVVAHRAAWSIFCGGIAPGLYVCHRCDVPACVNPDHLFLGTPSDNQQDRLRKGRLGAVRRKIDIQQASAILASEESSAALASRFGVTTETIRNVRRGKTFRYLHQPTGAN